MDNPPHNLFLINSQIDATNALQFVKECFDEMKPRKQTFIIKNINKQITCVCIYFEVIIYCILYRMFFEESPFINGYARHK